MALSSFAKVKFSEINFFVKTLQGEGEEGWGMVYPLSVSRSPNMSPPPRYGVRPKISPTQGGGEYFPNRGKLLVSVLLERFSQICEEIILSPPTIAVQTGGGLPKLQSHISKQFTHTHTPTYVQYTNTDPHMHT